MSVNRYILLAIALAILTTVACQQQSSVAKSKVKGAVAVSIPRSAKVVRTISTSADVTTSATLARALQEVDAIVIGSPTQPLNARTLTGCLLRSRNNGGRQETVCE